MKYSLSYYIATRGWVGSHEKRWIYALPASIIVKWCKQSRSAIWTEVINFISSDNNRYAKRASLLVTNVNEYLILYMLRVLRTNLSLLGWSKK